jgi:hypothetical protein
MLEAFKAPSKLPRRSPNCDPKCTLYRGKIPFVDQVLSVVGIETYLRRGVGRLKEVSGAVPASREFEASRPGVVIFDLASSL